MPIAPTRPTGEALVHAALLYSDDDQLRRTIGGFAQEAATAGQPLLAVLPFDSARIVDDALGDSGAAVTRLLAEEVGGNPGRIIPALRGWLDDQSGPARIISEATWPGRRAAELAECLRHEALVNVALADAAVTVLCPFDAAHLPAEIIAGARMTHPQIVVDGALEPSDAYGDPLDLARGENWPQTEPADPVCEVAFDGDLSALRRALGGHALLSAMDPGRRDDLVFAVNEAAGNAVRHGDGVCRMRLWRERDRVIVEVETPVAIDDPLAGLRRPGTEATSGRGLWLINQLCDLSEVRSGPDGTSVRMHVAVA